MSGLTDAVDYGNSTIDALQAAADSPLVGLIGLVFPQATAIIDVVRRYRGAIDAAQPIVKAAVEAGEPVFDKVVEQLPQFGKAVAKIMALAPAHPGGDGGSYDLSFKLENVARLLGGVGRMTPEEEKLWMDRATPGNDPSQENSKFTVG